MGIMFEELLIYGKKFTVFGKIGDFFKNNVF